MISTTERCLESSVEQKVSGSPEPTFFLAILKRRESSGRSDPGRAK